MLYKESMIAKINLQEIVIWVESKSDRSRNTLDVPGCDEECVDERVAKPKAFFLFDCCKVHIL